MSATFSEAERARLLECFSKTGFRITVAPGKLRSGVYTVSIVQRYGADIAVCAAVARLSINN